MDFIYAHPTIPWDWATLSHGIDMRISVFDPSYPWDWDKLSANTSITMEFLTRHLEFPWNWKCMSANPSIPIAFVEETPHLPWDWKELSFGGRPRDHRVFNQFMHTRHIMEELMMTVFHPKRVGYFLDKYNYFIGFDEYDCFDEST